MTTKRAFAIFVVLFVIMTFGVVFLTPYLVFTIFALTGRIQPTLPDIFFFVGMDLVWLVVLVIFATLLRIATSVGAKQLNALYQALLSKNTIPEDQPADIE
jgi:hypothetical protein